MNTTKIATCECGEPLVTTFVVPGKEMLCMGCGAAYAMFQPDMVDATPELETRQEQHATTLKEIASACIPPGSYLHGCSKCDAGEYHRDHAPPEEIKASDAAYGASHQLGYDAQ